MAAEVLGRWLDAEVWGRWWLCWWRRANSRVAADSKPTLRRESSELMLFDWRTRSYLLSQGMIGELTFYTHRFGPHAFSSTALGKA
jgi:hypothetical protein